MREYLEGRSYSKVVDNFDKIGSFLNRDGMRIDFYCTGIEDSLLRVVSEDKKMAAISNAFELCDMEDYGEYVPLVDELGFYEEY